MNARKANTPSLDGGRYYLSPEVKRETEEVRAACADLSRALSKLCDHRAGHAPKNNPFWIVARQALARHRKLETYCSRAGDASRTDLLWIAARAHALKEVRGTFVDLVRVLETLCSRAGDASQTDPLWIAARATLAQHNGGRHVVSASKENRIEPSETQKTIEAIVCVSSPFWLPFAIGGGLFLLGLLLRAAFGGGN